MKEKKEKTKKEPNGKKPFGFLRNLKYRRRQDATSIYFLLWAVFAILSLAIVLGCTLTQKFVLSQTYKEEASREVSMKGEKLQRIVSDIPVGMKEEQINFYLRSLSQYYDVYMYVLNEDGDVLHPMESYVNPEAPEMEVYFDFSQEIGVLLKKLGNEPFTVYEGDSEYVYGARLEGVFSGRYLYVTKSLELIETTNARMNVRVLLISVFLFVLSFAVTGAVAGWLTNPIAEMTKKAHQFAEGDFNVDFHGTDYGSEMVELAEALNFARDELSKTDRMQKELIANVSHDFKTPLTMIKGYASMIKEISGDNPEKREKHAQIIVDEADRLTSLVNDVLDLSKIRSGIETLKEETFNMSEYLYEILDRFAYLQETKGYKFITEIEDGLYTRADKNKIGQVLYNLIGNAVNYTGEDNTVYVQLKKESDEVFRFSVKDTGNGIKSEELKGIWERYYRSKDTHKRPVQGTGLGLSIVRTILERHRFYFGVRSKEGKGSTFYVLFPLNQ